MYPTLPLSYMYSECKGLIETWETHQDASHETPNRLHNAAVDRTYTWYPLNFVPIRRLQLTWAFVSFNAECLLSLRFHAS